MEIEWILNEDQVFFLGLTTYGVALVALSGLLKTTENW